MPAAQLGPDTTVNVMTTGTRKPPPGQGATAGGSTYCAGGGCQDVPQANPTVHCDVGANIPKYSDPTKRFVQANFAKSCLGDAGVTCDQPANAAAQTAAGSCCSCYLYSQIASNKYTPFPHAQSPNYVISEPKLDPHAAHDPTWHLMVMPTQPCSGVENWDKQKSPYSVCPGEDIWDAAHGVISRDIPCFAETYQWGMAINPVFRRGQHQMHVHVAAVYDSLLSSVATCGALGFTKCDVDCGKLDGSTRLDKCQYTTQSTTTSLKVEIVTGTQTAGGVKPFTKAYRTTPTNQGNALKGSTLVLRVPWMDETWAVVINTGGPAECFFNPHGNCDLVKACQQLPRDCKMWRPCHKPPQQRNAAECADWENSKCYQYPSDCLDWKDCVELHVPASGVWNTADCATYNTQCKGTGGGKFTLPNSSGC